MTTLADTNAPPASDPTDITRQDVLTDKRDDAATTFAEQFTPEALLRIRLVAFATEWDAPEMSVYDDYDVALAALKE